MFETFEEDGIHHVRGSVFVIAILDRNTLTPKGYLPNVLMTEEDADDLLFHRDQDKGVAYIVQEKQVTAIIHRSEQ
jgi:hypothetical protein